TTCGSRYGPSVGKMPRRTTPASGRWLRRAASFICSTSDTTRRARSTISTPIGVSITLRGARSISDTPSSSSSLRSWVDSAGWLTKLAAAARPKWRWSATALRYLRSRRFTRSGRMRFGQRRRGRRGADQVVERCERGLRTLAHRDHDLLVRHGGAVACGEHARDAGLAAVVDEDLAARRQADGAFEPFGVGQQADLHEHALQLDPVRVAAGAVP